MNAQPIARIVLVIRVEGQPDKMDMCCDISTLDNKTATIEFSNTQTDVVSSMSGCSVETIHTLVERMREVWDSRGGPV